jgi:mannosyltransferase OCH1-like enzyme
VLSVTSSFIIPILFGQHPVHGGYIGMFVDSRIKLYLWNQKVKDVEKRASELGLHTRLKTIQSRTRNVPYATTLELMQRYNMEKQHKLMLATTLQEHDMDKNSSFKAVVPWIIIRQKHVWNRPLLRLKNSTWAVFDFDFEDMDILMDTKNNMVGDKTYQRWKKEARMELCFIEFLCRYGGVYVNTKHNINQKDLQDFLDTREQDTSEWQDGWISIRDGNIDSLIVAANHTFLSCIAERLQEHSMMNATNVSVFQAILDACRSMSNWNWNGNTHGYVRLPKNCESLPMNFSLPTYNKHNIITSNLPVKDIVVNITAVNESVPKYAAKITIDQLLSSKSMFCNGIWMWPCHRCLKSAIKGSYDKCSWACSSCLNFMYDHPTQNDESNHDDDDKTVHVRIHVHGYLYHLDSSDYKLIPRIIHQTWFEHITPMNYPYLYRLQNQWKMSGWEYRFYTDDTARQYVIDNYPLHFLEAYDALIPGAYKADLFRYMLLLKEGGIYADVDVMLETSLEQFVTPGMTFFAPRDCVAEFADGQYCLWNGIIGVAPGHPIIVRAVERLINSILNRSDLLDLEREIAKKSGRNTETWKVRAVQELLLSGPCALGIAANEVLGRKALTKFGVGWLYDHIENPKNFGDMMILMVSY